MDLALNNLQRLICHKTKPNKQTNKSITWFCFVFSLVMKCFLHSLVPDPTDSKYSRKYSCQEYLVSISKVLSSLSLKENTQ